jgi:HlyD family secretion protein
MISSTEQIFEKKPTPARGSALGWLRRHKVLVFGFIAFLGAGAFGLNSLRGSKVKVVSPTRRPIVQRVVATGRVEPPARISIGAQLSATAIHVGPEEGDTVKVGDMLVELDPAEAQAAVDQAQAGVGAAQARLVQLKATGSLVATEGQKQSEITLANAETSLARVESLMKSQAATQKELDDARKQVDLAKSQRESARLQAAAASPSGGDSLLAQANLAQAQAALALAKARLAQMRLTAPADGIILSRQVEPGDLVLPSRALFVLARAGKTRLVAQPDEKSLAYLAPGQKALASVDAFPAQTFAAQVATVAPAVDPSRGTIEVKLDVPQPPAYLRADMTVSIDVEVARADDALVLPADVVQDPATARPWVFMVESGKVQKRQLKLGLRGEGWVQILEGLREGDQVIAADGKPLRVGQSVRAEKRDD